MKKLRHCQPMYTSAAFVHCCPVMGPTVKTRMPPLEVAPTVLAQRTQQTTNKSSATAGIADRG